MKFSENVFPALPRTELLEVDGRENCSTNFVTDNHCRKGVIDHRVLLADSIHFDKKKKKRNPSEFFYAAFELHHVFLWFVLATRPFRVLISSHCLVEVNLSRLYCVFIPL